MIKNYINKTNLIYLIFFFNQICSIRFFLSSSFFNKDITFFYLYVIFSCLVFYYLFKKKILDYFLSDNFLYLILGVAFVTLLFIYPYADNLKFYMQGSDQDNCYIDVLDNIYKNKTPIYNRSYLGNPCSTGLLAFLFYFPLIFWKNYFALVPIIFLLLFKKCNQIILEDNKLSNLLTLILLSNLTFLELSASGSDFISISISYVAANIFLIRGLKINSNFWLLISFIFFLFFFGSRSILLILIIPLFIIYFYNFKNKRILIYFFFLSSMSLASYLIPYYLMLPNEFPPFHLISKAIWYFENVKYILILLFITIIMFKNNFMKFFKINILLLILMTLLIPLFISSFSGFLHNIKNLNRWEELNYIYLFTPALYTFLFSSYKKIIKL